MHPETFKQVQKLFYEAIDQAPEDRIHYVEHVSGNSREVVDEVISLLKQEQRAAGLSTARPLAAAVDAFEAMGARRFIGKVVGRFRLESEIASGGMGRVFRALRIDDDIDQIVAVKMVREDSFDDALLRRFSAERKILASLNHPGIAHLIDAGTDDSGAPFVVMEYVDGLSLHRYCAAHSPSIRERIELFRQILSAVSYAHRNLVLHRDLKPTNILVTPDGRPKLLDFGIAKTIGTDERGTTTADRFFTPAYAAPECFHGQATGVASDIYALGAILYALLAGAAPFESSTQTPGEIEHRILMVPPTRMRATVSALGEAAMRSWGIVQRERWIKDLDGDLENIVQKALRKEPESRYSSVEKFDEDLVRYLERRPVMASGAAWLYRARKFCERNAVAMMLAVSVAAVSLAGVGYILTQNKEIAEQNNEIRNQRDRAQALLEIFKNALRTVNPTNSGARGYPQARNMLKAAEYELNKFEKTQPDLFRDLSYEVGEIQVDLGMRQSGLALIRKGHLSAHGSSESGVLAEIHALVLDNKAKEARAILDAYRAHIEDPDRFAAEELHVLIAEKRYQDAIALGEKLILGKTIGDSPVVFDHALILLDKAYSEVGALDKAVESLDKHVALREKHYGKEHPLTMMSRSIRAQRLMVQQDYARAEAELVAIKPIVERDDNIYSGVKEIYYGIYGYLLSNTGRKREAVDYYRRSLVDADLSSNIRSPNSLAGHLNLAVAISETSEDRSEAYPHFMRAISGFEIVAGKSAPVVGRARYQAAMAYIADENHELAMDILTPAHAADYLESMPDSQRQDYLEAMHTLFGPQDCLSGGNGSHRAYAVAQDLLCRYRSGGEPLQ
jgi:eukaryotic-like serine/threonine-protein kinase